MLVGFNSLLAQTACDQGDRALTLKQYHKALVKYKRCLEKTKEPQPIHLKMAECYNSLYNYTKASMHLKTYLSIQKKYSPTVIQYLQISHKYLSIRDFESLVDSFINLYPQQRPLRKLKEIQWNTTPSNYNISKEEFNSEWSDFAPTFWNDYIIFSSSRPSNTKSDPTTGHNFVRLMMMDTMTKSISDFTLQNISPFNIGSCAFANEGRTLFFTANDKTAKNKKGHHLLKIYTSSWEAETWTSPKELPFNLDNLNNMHPAVTTDGQLVIFAADNLRDGQLDLYQTMKLKNGTWSRPSKLPAQINTKGNEIFPFFVTDSILVYSTNGHDNGFTGFDFYTARYQNKKWGQPQKMPEPLNSSGDDFGFWSTTDMQQGWFSSNRLSEDGSENIYRFQFNEAIIDNSLTITDTILASIPIHIAFINDVTKVSIKDMGISMTNLKDGRQIEMKTDENGEIKINFQPEEKWILDVETSGFLPLSKIIEFNPNTEINDKNIIHLTPLIKDQVIILENIYFDFDKWELSDDSQEELLRAIGLLKNNPNMTIEISSHTDIRGRTPYNQTLSEKRAQSVYNYMISAGIKKERMTYKGYGATQLLNHCDKNVECTEREHRENRRTELKIKSL